MNRLSSRICMMAISICTSKACFGENLKINTLGCVLSIPNVSDISVVGSGDVTFMFRKADSSPLQQLIVSKYPGDEKWFAEPEETEKVNMVRGKYLTFEKKTISLKNREFVFQLLTDRKVVLYFHIIDSEMSDYLDCGS